MAHRYTSSKVGKSLVPVLVAILATLSIGMFLINLLWPSGANQAKQTVRDFYTYEQSGDYGSAWDLLHPQMKERFTKEQYIRTRASVFMQQLEAKTFDYQLGEVNHLNAWRMTQDSPELANVYEIQVEQTVQTIFGEWLIQQKTYAVKHEGYWKLLWSYPNSVEGGPPA